MSPARALALLPIVGRLATIVAMRLRGKHKASYTPHVDCGDNIIVLNAEKIAVTGDKLRDKMYYHHTGYPGGLKDFTFSQLIGRDPIAPLELAIRGMLPKGPLGRKLYKNAKIYAGPNHPHTAQAPVAIDIE